MRVDRDSLVMALPVENISLDRQNAAVAGMLS